MSARDEPARVLVAAAPSRLEQLRPLFASLLRGWDVIEADSLHRMYFLDQMHPCDALALDTALVRDSDVSQLRGAVRKPVVLLGEADLPPALQLRAASWTWLPFESVLRCPPLLGSTLGHLAEVAALQDRQAQLQAALRGCQQQVDGLVDLLWQVVPGELPGPWFSQRHMLQRCAEEVARSQRHATPLSLVLGEFRLHPSHGGDEAGPRGRQVAETICRLKRRSDVAGQYGLDGFMLLLPSTAAAGAVACCQRLHQGLAGTPSGEAATRLQVAFGVADCPSTAATVEGLLRQAEEGLGRARAGGVPLAS
jgi:diguanylate cyclase (GGDEF)-like protein